MFDTTMDIDATNKIRQECSKNSTEIAEESKNTRGIAGGIEESQRNRDFFEESTGIEESTRNFILR